MKRRYKTTYYEVKGKCILNNESLTKLLERVENPDKLYRKKTGEAGLGHRITAEELEKLKTQPRWINIEGRFEKENEALRHAKDSLDDSMDGGYAVIEKIIEEGEYKVFSRKIISCRAGRSIIHELRKENGEIIQNNTPVNGVNFGLNKTQIQNRELVKNSKESGRSQYVEGETITGHIYEPDGTYSKYYLVPTYTNIANFICYNQKDKLLCNGDDYAIACTLGNYIDIADDDFLKYLLPIITPIQKSGRKVEFQKLD